MMITAGKRSLAPLVAALGHEAAPATDGELLTRFLARRDEAAFEVLVRRHGPMVLAVCRRTLGCTADADDAFQATFLVLLRKAPGLASRPTLGDWLHGVARRTALKARSAAARRRAREGAAARPERDPQAERNDWLPWLDEEVGRLPARYRQPLVLCDLEGRTRTEAARALGWPEGTVAGYLARGRAMLARRLLRRASALGGVVAGAVAAGDAQAIPARLLEAARPAALGSASPTVLALAREVIRSMTTITNALALGALALAVGGLLATGTLLPAAPEPQPPAAAVPGLSAAAAEPGRAPPDHGDRVYSVSYSPDGKRFLSIGGGTAVVWDSETHRKVFAFDAEFAAYSGDGKTLFVLVKDEFRTLDADTGKQLATRNRQKPKESGLLGGRFAAFAGNGLMWVEFDGVRHHLRTAITDDLYDLADQRAYDPLGPTVPGYGRGGAFSPDGKRFAGLHAATIDSKETACLTVWNPTTGVRVGTIFRAKHPVRAFAWSPDGTELAVGYADGVRVYDAKTLQEVRKLDMDGATVIAWSPDGKTLAVGREVRHYQQDGPADLVGVLVLAIKVDVRLLDSHTGKELRVIGGFADNLPLVALAFRPDGKELVCGAGFLPSDEPASGAPQPAKDAKGLHVIPLDAPEKLKVEPKPGYVSDVRFAPDGKRYAVVIGGEVRIHDAATDKLVFTLPGEAAGYTADGKKLFVMGTKVLECDPGTGKTIKEHPRPKPKLGWHLVSFSPDGTRYAAHFGFHVRVYDTATGFEPQQLDDQHEPGSSAFPGTTGKQLMWSPDGKQVAAVGVLVAVAQLGTAGWDVETGTRFYSAAADFTDGPRAVAFSGDGKALAIGYGRRVDVWTGGKNPVKNLGEHGVVTALAFAPDGKTLAVGMRLPIFHGGDKPLRVIGHKTEVRLLDLTADTDKPVKVFDGFEGVAHMATTKLPVSALAFSPDGKKLIAGTGLANMTEIPEDAPKSGEVKVFVVPARPEQPDPAPAADQKWTDTAVLSDHGRLVNGVAVAPDGRSFAAATDGNVTCWDATTRKVLWTHKTGAPFHALVYGPDSKHLFAAGKAEVVRLDAATGKELELFGKAGIGLDNFKQKIEGHPARALAVSPDGKRLAGSDGFMAWTVELDEPGNHSTRTHGDPPAKDRPAPAGVAWSKDGKWLAALHPKHTARTVPSGARPEAQWKVRVWNGAGDGAAPVLPGHDAPVTALAWSKNGTVIASGDEKGFVILSDAATGKELWRHQFRGRDDTDGRINALALSPADNTVAVAVSLGSGKGADRVVLLAAKDGAVAGQVMRWAIPVASVAWSPDGTFFVTGCGAAGRGIRQTEPAAGEVVVWERKP